MDAHHKEYEEALWRWFKARKEYPNINHGPMPKMEEYGFLDQQQQWYATQIRRRVETELNRKE